MRRLWRPEAGPVGPFIAHAGSALLCAVQGVWLAADLWFVHGLSPAEDIPVAAGAVGPPGLAVLSTLAFSLATTSYTAVVLAAWVRLGRGQAAAERHLRWLVAGLWVAAIAVSRAPFVRVEGDVLDSAITFLRDSCLEAATSAFVLLANLVLALAVSSRLRHRLDLGATGPRRV